MKTKEKQKEYSKNYYLLNCQKIKEYQRKYNDKNIEKVKNRKKEYYQKNKERFSLYNKSLMVKERRKQNRLKPNYKSWYHSYSQRPEVKERRKLLARERRKNPKVKQHEKEYNNSPKRKILIKEYFYLHKERIKQHKDKYRFKNKDKIKKYMKEYKETEIGKAVFDKAIKLRRLREKNIINLFTLEEWQLKVKNCNNKCPICSNEFTSKPKSLHYLTIDHTPPISKVPFGFVYTIDDVNPMCMQCNSLKSNKLKGLK